MSSTQLRETLEKVSTVLRANPAAARSANPLATAVLLDGLRCQVTGPGDEKAMTDMPRAVGGAASAPSPGWLMRAALASCNATCIALRAAAQGIELAALEVTVASETDTRALLDLDPEVPAGLQNLRVQVRISASGASASELEALVRAACARSPVGCTDTSTAVVEVKVE